MNSVVYPNKAGIFSRSGLAVSSGIQALSASYTVPNGIGPNTLFVTSGADDRVITLPPAASNAGAVLYIKKVDTGAGSITVTPNGAETIDGAATIVMYTQNMFLELCSDGANWQIIDQGSEFIDTTTLAISNAGTSPSGRMILTKKGRLVSLSAQLVNGSGSPTADALMTAPIPVYARPLGALSRAINFSTGSDTISFATVGTDGNITFSKRLLQANADTIVTANFSAAEAVFVMMTYGVG